MKTSGCVNLCEIIAEAVDNARAVIQRESSQEVRLAIETRVSASLPDVRGQTAELQRLFLSLLIDVGQIAAEGKIEVDSAIENEFVILRVLSERSLIPLNQLINTFEPVSTKEGPRRTITFLSTAREVMQDLGGSITAGNCGPDGVIFTLRFPVAPKDSSPPILFGCRD